MKKGNAEGLLQVMLAGDQEIGVPLYCVKEHTH